MPPLPFFIVDVFASNKYTGNQLAIVICDRKLEKEEMQTIAREMNFKETSFVDLSDANPEKMEVRLFTPHEEISYSGHSVLGTAFVIHNFIKDAPSSSLSQGEEIEFNLKKGKVKVEIHKNPHEILSEEVLENTRGAIYWVQTENIAFGRDYEKVLFSKILGIEVEEINEAYPIIEIESGLNIIIIPIKDLETMKKIKINKERYNWFIQRSKAKVLLAFCTETVDPKNHVHVRVFADYFGIPEDPATGSGNAALAAYLVKYSVLPEGNEGLIRIEQGIEVKRKSLILATVHQEQEGYRVKVGGPVILIAKGDLY